MIKKCAQRATVCVGSKFQHREGTFTVVECVYGTVSSSVTCQWVHQLHVNKWQHDTITLTQSLQKKFHQKLNNKILLPMSLWHVLNSEQSFYTPTSWFIQDSESTANTHTPYLHHTTTVKLVQPFDAHCCHKGTAIKHHVPDWVKPSFEIVDIRSLWRSGLSVRVPGCEKLQLTV